MLAATWSLRPDGHTLDSYKEYCNHPTAFTFKINHGGQLTCPPNVRYIGGKSNFRGLERIWKRSRNLIQKCITGLRIFHHNIGLGRPHCDVLLNNMCEVLNRQLLKGRDKPIVTCLEFIREYLMKRIVIVQGIIDKSTGPLTPNATKLFNLIKRDAAQYKVNVSEDNENVEWTECTEKEQVPPPFDYEEVDLEEFGSGTRQCILMEKKEH
ncbi:hypothetical protein Tco_0610510 [Tanacetum coccineum]